MSVKVRGEFKVEVDKMIKDAKNVVDAAREAAVEIKREAGRELLEIGRKVAGKGGKIELKVDIRLGERTKPLLRSDFRDPVGDVETWSKDLRKSQSIKYF